MGKKPDLSVYVWGLKFPNFLMLASGPPTGKGEMIRRAFDKGWGGAVTKTIKTDTMEIRDVSPRFHAIRDGRGKLVGFENFELVTPRPLNYWLKEIADTKRKYPGNILFASIMAELEQDKWQELAVRVERAGADGIEVNLSCPHGMPEKGLGAAMGQDPEITYKVIKWVKGAVRIPVIAKLTPNVSDITIIARAAELAGADGFAAINTVQSLIGIDLETFNPLPDVAGASTFGGYSGNAVKPIGLRVVAQLAGCTKLPVMGMGGIEKWEHAAEYMLVGASLVQVCTGVMLKGYKLAGRMLAGMEKYLLEKGFDSVTELRGKSLSRLASHESLTRDVRVSPVFDAKTCKGCASCLIACRDGGHQAITKDKNAPPVVDKENCDGCGLCALVCSSGSIAMETYGG